MASDEPAPRAGRGRPGKSAPCRVCRLPLATVADRKVGRHEGCPSPYDEGLFERLREWRKRTADEASVPAFVIFTDLTLQAIAEVKPSDEHAMRQISGIGPSKWEKYGSDVLALVNSD